MDVEEENEKYLREKFLTLNGKDSEINKYNEYLASKGYSYFYEEEFGKPFKVEDLYNEVKGKDYDGVPLKDTDKKLDNLNKLLEIPNFYDKLCQKENKKGKDFSKDVQYLDDGTQEYRKKNYSELSEEKKRDIRRLNRLVLEEIFPEKCPKDKFSFEEAKRRRNIILINLIYLANIHFEGNELYMYQGHATISTVADIAVLGVTAAGTLAGGKDTKAILSAIAAGLTGSRLAYEKNWLYQYGVPVLFARMNRLRETKRNDINEKMKNGIQEYSLEQGLIDIQEYFNCGTMVGALQNISKENVKPTDSFEEAKKYKKEIDDLFKEYRVNPTTGEKKLNESNP